MKLKLQASPETETWDLCAITGYLFFYFITPLMCCLIETVVNNLHFFDISLTLKRFERAENPKKKKNPEYKKYKYIFKVFSIQNCY